MLNNRIDLIRPSKRDVFFRLACDVATLSPDSQTICGCIITSKDNRLMASGYNGFPRDCNNDILPNIRPYKYKWVQEQHAEKNAVNNCIVRPKDIGGGTAYVTGQCCFGCVCHLWNNHIDEIWQMEGFSYPVMVNEEDSNNTAELVEHLEGRLKIHTVKADFSRINERISDSQYKRD